VANLPAKFEISSFSRSRDMEGVRKFKILNVGHVTPFDLILHFLVRISSGQSVCQI